MPQTIAFNRRLAGWRVACWSAAAALLALPAIAMLFTHEVDWTAGDFAFAAILLGVTGLAAEGALRVSDTWPQLIGYGLAILAALLTVWSNLAVGIVGEPGGAINLGFFAVLFAGVATATVNRFAPRALAHTTGVLAVSQLAMGLAAMQAMPDDDVVWGALALLAGLWLGASLALRFHTAKAAG